MEITKKKCPQCGLVNFSTDMECRRCGGFITRPAATHSNSEQKQSPLSPALLALVAFLLVAGGIWYWSGRTNSNQPVLNAESLPETTITPAPTIEPAPRTALDNINPHDERQIQKIMVPLDEERVKQFHEQQRKAIDDLGKRVQKPFAQGPPQ